MSKLSLLAVVALAVPFTSGCGGCPWTQLSDLVVTPDTPCLDLQLADSSGNAPSTGCVDPVVYGQNNCTDALVVPAQFTTTGVDQTFQPGANIVLEVQADSSTRDHGDNFAIAAMLGADPVTISFHASGGIAGN